jgi:hypothetical protein
MGLFDRVKSVGTGSLDRVKSFVNSGSEDSKPIQPRPEKSKKAEAFFLDSDSSSSLGDRDYMRESKTIRRTFPGTVDSPGTKERVSEVASNTEQVTRRSDGLGGVVKKDPEPVSPVGGVPKPVKKTFAEQVSSAEMKQRLKGAAVSGVNVPASPDAAPLGRKESLKPEPEVANSGSVGGLPPTGSIDPFRQMVRDLNK